MDRWPAFGAMVVTERLLSAPDGTNAWRVLYHSTDVTGADIIVSGRRHRSRRRRTSRKQQGDRLGPPDHRRRRGRDNARSKLCAAGEDVIFKMYPDTTHATVANKAAPDVVSFFGAVLAGNPPASTC